MDEQIPNNTIKKRERSPSYPAIDLETAIQKTKILKEKEGGGKYYSPLRAVLSHWGYKIKSGFALRILAALQKYNLIEVKGTGNSRQVRLTELAQKILFYAPDTQIYQEAISEAALGPMIYNELWQKYDKTIPSDTTLLSYLVFERKPGYAENVAKDLIEHFRASISFANLLNSANISEHDEDKKYSTEENSMNTATDIRKDDYSQAFLNVPTDNKQTINFPVKVSKKMTANLQIQCPVEEEDLKDFLSALEALKPGILKSVLDEDE